MGDPALKGYDSTYATQAGEVDVLKGHGFSRAAKLQNKRGL
jgi:hypothetical protein